MPKWKRKGKYDRNGSGQTSEEDDCNDNASVFSMGSEVRSNDGDNEEEEQSQQEAYEERIAEALDGLSQKSAQGRTNCYEGLCKAFQKKYIPDFVEERKMTVCDGVERGLKKGRGAEQAAAAQLASLLCVQLGAGDSSEEVCKSLKPILLVIANDNSMQPTVRAKCCSALGLITFLSGGEMGDVLDIMKQMEHIFSGSYLRGGGTVPNVSVDIGMLHAAALNAWGLLFTLMSPGDVYSMLGSGVGSFSPSIEQLSDMLTSPHLDVRMAAGEALALVFELGRSCRDDFAENYIDELVDALHQLATDSNKHRAKKDRKAQRATFRDILNYIENDQFSEERVKFQKEVLYLDSWCRHKQYDALCNSLGSGLNTHLAENELLRDIFELGDKVVIGEVPTSKTSKLERNLVNAAAFKARTISRGKNRDKRCDF